MRSMTKADANHGMNHRTGMMVYVQPNMPSSSSAIRATPAMSRNASFSMTALRISAMLRLVHLSSAALWRAVWYCESEDLHHSMCREHTSRWTAASASIHHFLQRRHFRRQRDRHSSSHRAFRLSLFYHLQFQADHLHQLEYLLVSQVKNRV